MKINIKGLSTNYIKSEEGKKILLFLHGWGADINSFNGLLQHFKKKYTTIALDLPGFGDSEEPKEFYDIYDYADFVEEFIKTLKLENPIILGHSFGGRIAIILNTRKAYDKLVLLDSAGIKPKRTIKYYLKIYTYKIGKRIISLLGDDFRKRIANNVGSEDYRRASEKMRGIMSKVVNQDLRQHLPEIKASTLLIWGENDEATPVSDAKLMEKLIPDAGLVIIKGASHFSFAEQPGFVIRVLEAFFKEEL